MSFNLLLAEKKNRTKIIIFASFLENSYTQKINFGSIDKYNDNEGY